MSVTNTLETARRLESLSFSHQQAQGLAEALESAAGDTRGGLATRADLDALEKATRADLVALEKATRADLVALEKSLRAEIQQLRTGMK